MQLVADHDAAPAQVQHARQLGEPFTLLITGPVNTRLIGGILVAALQDALPLDQVAVMSWQSGTALRQHVRAMIAKAMKYPPDLALEDMIPGSAPELIGSVCHVLDGYTNGGSDPVTGAHRRQVADEFAELIKRANDMGEEAADHKFLRGVRRQVDAVIRLSIGARCEGVQLLEAYREALAGGARLPAWSFVTEVAAYFRDFKRDCKVADLADQLGAELEPVTGCTLALLEDTGNVPPLGLAALRRLLPNASFVLGGVEGEAAHKKTRQAFDLAGCHQQRKVTNHDAPRP
jgi:hypothetical protein